ncbi:MAG: hypothetical protein GY794_04880 [bacterium]|nr:hypothetical protein [bacterium]
MKRLLSACTGLLICCAAVPAIAVEKVTAKVDGLHIVRLPKKEVFDKGCGTTVKFSLTHASKRVSGIDAEASKISFTDSTGKDLFAAGKKQKAEYKKNRKGFFSSSGAKKENCVSRVARGFLEREKADPKQVLIQCHALATPAKDAKSISIKGKLVLKTDAGKKKSVTVAPSDLAADKVIKLGKNSLKFVAAGSGSMGKEKFVSLSCETDVVIKSISVIGKESKKHVVQFQKGSGDQKASMEVFGKNLAATDKVKIVYSVPQTETVDIDLTINPGFASE